MKRKKPPPPKKRPRPRKTKPALSAPRPDEARRPIPLEDRRDAFAREYVVDHNATAAARRAGYETSSARFQGSRLLTYVNIQARIADLELAAAQRAEIRADEVVRELGYLAFSDVTEVFEPGATEPPTTDQLKALPHGIRRAIHSLEVEYVEPTLSRKGDVVVPARQKLKLRMHPKQPALEALGKRTGAIPAEPPAGGDDGVHFHFHGGPMGFEKAVTERA